MQYSIVASAIAAILAVSPLVTAQAAKPTLNVTTAVPAPGRPSTGYYGRTNGQMQAAVQCPAGSFVVGITATVTYGIRSLAFQCSDGSSTKCAGTCDQYPQNGLPVDMTAPKGISAKDSPQTYSMVSASGFDNLWVNADRDVASLKSRVDYVDYRIMSDQEPFTDHWYKWPTAEDVMSVTSGNRLVLSGINWWKHNDIASIQPIFVSTTPYTPLPVPATPKPSVLTFNPAVGAVVSQSVFGHNDGKQYRFDCPDGSFIYKMTAGMNRDFYALKYTCSDEAATSSQCYGTKKSCDSLAALLPNNGLSVVDQDHPALMTMTAPNGFTELYVNSGWRVTAMKSKDAWLNQNLYPDNFVKGNWVAWPNVDNTQFPGAKVLTGMITRYDDDINQVVPIFRILGAPVTPTPAKALGANSTTTQTTQTTSTTTMATTTPTPAPVTFQACQYQCTVNGGNPYDCAAKCHASLTTTSTMPTTTLLPGNASNPPPVVPLGGLQECVYICVKTGGQPNACVNKCSPSSSATSVTLLSTPVPKYDVGTYQGCVGSCTSVGMGALLCKDLCASRLTNSTTTSTTSVVTSTPCPSSTVAPASATSTTTPCPSSTVAPANATSTTTPCPSSTATTSCTQTVSQTLTHYTIATVLPQLPSSGQQQNNTNYGSSPSPSQGNNQTYGAPVNQTYGTPAPAYGKVELPYCDEVNTTMYTPEPQNGHAYAAPMYNSTANSTSDNSTTNGNNSVSANQSSIGDSNASGATTASVSSTIAIAVAVLMIAV